ncbi:MAG: chemotaxis protein CheW [Candidatus Bathyarchaeia archaeon]
MDARETDKQQIIVFKLEDRFYGVDISQIREITRVGEITPMPNSPFYIEGVTNLRGQVTTVIDMRKKLGLPTKKVGKETRMMVIEYDNRPVGMIVDSISEVTMLSKADIEKTPEITKKAQRESHYIKGIGKKDNKLIILIDLYELLEECKSTPKIEMIEPATEEETAVSS